MSKVEQAKTGQGYTREPARCSTCVHYRCERTETPHPFGLGPLVAEKHRRCAVGGFAVLASAICDLYERRK